MSKILSQHKRDFLILGLVIIFYAINNFIWLKKNTYPSGPDEFWHLLRGLKFSKAILSNPQEFLYLFAENPSHWPPLFHMSSAVVTFFAGTSYSALVMTNIIYLAILLFSIYFIGIKLFDQNTGLLAAIIISAYPMIFISSRFFNPDFALAAMACLSICFLIYSDFFKDRKFSMLFGLSFGLGMLAKISFILFLIGPLSYIFLGMKNKKIQSNKIVLNFIIAAGFGTLIVFLWYWTAFSTLVYRTKVFLWTILYHSFPNRFFAVAPRPEDNLWIYLSRLPGYAKGLAAEQISFLFLIVFLAALPFFLRLRNNLKRLIILWFVVPYVILSLSFQQEARFMIASLPAIALISAAGIQNMSSRKVKAFFGLSIFILGLVQFFDISYNDYRKDRSPHFLQFKSEHHGGLLYGPPLRKDLQVDIIADSIARYFKKQGNRFPVNIGIVCDDDRSTNLYGYPEAIDYSLAKKGIYLTKSTLLTGVDFNKKLDFIVNAGESNFFVFISKDSSWPDTGVIFDNFVHSLERKMSTVRPGTRFKFPALNKISYSTNDIIGIAKEGFKKFLDDNKPVERVALPDGYFAYIHSKAMDSIIYKGPLQLYLNNGNCKLYFKDIEVTKQWGLYSIFFSGADSYGPLTANWEIDRLTSSKLIAKAEWPGLPIVCIWTLEALENNTIDWQIDIEAKEKVQIEAGPYVNLVLSYNYQNWFTLNKQGRFLKISPKQKRWEWLDSPSPSVWIGARNTKIWGNLLPGVLLNIDKNLILNYTVPQNTDYSVKARTLGVRRQKDGEESLELEMGYHRIFAGRIVLFEKDREMKFFLEKIRNEK